MTIFSAEQMRDYLKKVHDAIVDKGDPAPDEVMQVGGIDGSDDIQPIAVDAAGNQSVKLTGSIPEYMWLDAAEPDPGDDGFTLAMGVQIDTATHEMTVKYYNGTSWEEVA